MRMNEKEIIFSELARTLTKSSGIGSLDYL